MEGKMPYRQFLRANRSDELVSCDQADEGRRRGVMLCAAVLAGVAITAPVFYINYFYSLAVLFLYMSAGLALGVLLIGLLLAYIRSSRRRFRLVLGGVELRSPGLFPVGELCIVILLLIGAGDTLLLTIVSPYADQYEGRHIAFMASLAMIILLIISWSITESYELPGRRAITLSPDGLRFSRKHRQAIDVPWCYSPQVMGVRRRNGEVIINFNEGMMRPVEIPLRLVPISYVRFEQIISFYASHPELRHELGTDAGLARVQDLMKRYAWEIEEDL